MNKFAKGSAVAGGGCLLALLWAVSIASSLAVPALAIWALLHFAFHVV